MSKDNHSFSIAVACEIGERGALLIQHLLFLQKSIGEENWREKWVRRSAKSLANTYPYWSGKQIAAISDSLEKGGYIASKIENANKYDRTKSYILTEKGLLLMGENDIQKGKVAFAQMENGEAETENVDLPNGEMSIKEDCNSFCNSFIEEEKGASLSSSSPETPTLKAEKEKPTPQVAPPPPPISVTIYEPPTYDQIPNKGYPQTEPAGEFQRVDVQQEIEALRTDTAMREAFTMSRKIPSVNYADYLEAFRIDVTGRGERYATVKQLRAHFLNWCGTRFEIQNRKAAQQQPTQTGQPAKIRQL